MPIALEIRTPTLSARTSIPAGRSLSFGGEAGVDVHLDDARLAPLHFVVHAGHDACSIRGAPDVGGTTIDGRETSEGTAADGSVVAAGDATVTVRVRAPSDAWFDGALAHSPADASLHATTWRAAGGAEMHEALVGVLRRQPGELHALVDAARDEEVLARLRASGLPYTSLFPGEAAMRLEKAAPYLVRFPASSPLLPLLVRRGWDASWGIYLASRRPLDEIVRALQELLVVRDESGRVMYFRFYDPRVLRTFLPMATPAQADAFFAAADVLLFAGSRRGSLVRCARFSDRAAEVPKSAPRPATSPASVAAPEGPRAAIAAIVDLTLEQHAALHADVFVFPERVDEIYAAYGVLDDARRAAIDETWRDRMERDPAAHDAWWRAYEARVRAVRGG